MQEVKKRPSTLMLGLCFIFSLFLNCLGNALTVSLNLGSALWTASAVNISNAVKLPLGLILFFIGSIIIITNSFLIKKIDLRRIIGNLIFMVPFAWLVGYLSPLLVDLGITHLPLGLKIGFDFLGVIFFSTAVSIYQRINWALHPADDLMQILRFKFFKGNPIIAQLVSFTPPILAIIIAFLVTGRIEAINVGTIFALVFQGALIGLADKFVLPKLKHLNVEKAIN